MREAGLLLDLDGVLVEGEGQATGHGDRAGVERARWLDERGVARLVPLQPVAGEHDPHAVAVVPASGRPDVIERMHVAEDATGIWVAALRQRMITADHPHLAVLGGGEVVARSGDRCSGLEAEPHRLVTLPVAVRVAEVVGWLCLRDRDGGVDVEAGRLDADQERVAELGEVEELGHRAAQDDLVADDREVAPPAVTAQRREAAREDVDAVARRGVAVGGIRRRLEEERVVLATGARGQPDALRHDAAHCHRLAIAVAARGGER